MGKLLEDAVLDAGFDNIVTNGNQMVACETEPTNYTQAHATYMLAYVALAGGDYAKAADTSGRKCTVAAKAAVAVAGAGTANWVCIIDTVSAALKAKTTCNAQALAAGGTVDFPAWVLHNPQPT